MPLDVRLDERALRQHAQPACTHVVQGPADELRRHALTLEGRIGLGVRDDDEVRPGDVRGEGDDLPLDRADVPVVRLVLRQLQGAAVLDGGSHGRQSAGAAGTAQLMVNVVVALPRAETVTSTFEERWPRDGKYQPATGRVEPRRTETLPVVLNTRRRPPDRVKTALRPFLLTEAGRQAGSRCHFCTNEVVRPNASVAVSRCTLASTRRDRACAVPNRLSLNCQACRVEE